MSSVYVDETGYGSVELKDGKIYFTDIMGIRTVFDGTLQQIDLTENFIIVK